MFPVVSDLCAFTFLQEAEGLQLTEPALDAELVALQVKMQGSGEGLVRENVDRL